ncbi:hypothetical protein SGQ83_08110 [Flavobacterium sp. Fl-318]|uniref:Uncharacterized protein n=1 Tax=Flavobacterium cupriresistens TaxID=2893885 RepID=A0ABU4R9Q0_9FLAO|nr:MULTISPECIES: hypothetical protein [unclassified Flavobacterium]MDX6189305.1 hypothetical protein [Flavobacterium sp. Fl-318]UFH41401.1 hypothetical protein LNP23_16480 [Flavobacterium sp. F-323]
MTGIEFYTFLRSNYIQDGQQLYGNYSFKKWLHKKDSQSFQFNGNKPLKSIPKNWLIDAKNAKNRGEKIDRNWFNNFYEKQNFNDCRASVAIWLIENFTNK